MAKPKHNGNRFIVAKRLVPQEIITAVKPTIARAYAAYLENKLALVLRLLHYTEEFPYAGEFTKAPRASTCRVCGEQVNKNSKVFILYYNFRGHVNTSHDASSGETTCYMHLKCVLDDYQEPDTTTAIA